MCQIAIDRVQTDTLQQATTLTVYVSGKCEHGGDAYLRVIWAPNRLGAESAFRQVSEEFHHLILTYTAHNLFDQVKGVRAVLRCKAKSVYQEVEV